MKLQAILEHASIKRPRCTRTFAPDHPNGATTILDGLGAKIDAPSTHEAQPAEAAAVSVL